jgi:hypothetical protein
MRKEEGFYGKKSHGCINPRKKAPGSVTQDTVK